MEVMPLPAPRRDRRPGSDQALVQRIVLVGVARHDLALDRIIEPHPLKHRGLEHRGRRVGVVFEQLGGTATVVAEIEAAVEARIITAEACRDEIPVALGDAQRPHHPLIVGSARDELAAHAVKLGGRRLEVALDLLQRETVVGALVPVGLAIERVKQEADALGGVAPVGTLLAGDALH
jgi:hydrogenase maturation factor